MLPSEASLGLSVMTPGWVKVAAWYLSGFRLAFAVASFITALCHSSLVALLITLMLIWHFVAQRKSIGRPLTVCTIFPYGLADGRLHDLIVAVLPSPKRDASGALGANRLYAARTVVWVVPSTERCSLESAVIYMLLPSHVDPKVVDPPPVSSSVPIVYDVDLGVEDEWDLSDKLRSGEMDVCSSLRVDIALIRDKCVEHSVEAPTTAADVFNLASHGLSSLGEQRDLLAGVDQLHHTIQSSMA